MLRKGGAYYLELYDRTYTQLSAVTLSALGHKVYVIFSPSLAQAALRSRDLSFDPFIILANDVLVNLSPSGMEMLRNGPLISQFAVALQGATAPEPMRRMATTGLASISAQLEELVAEVDASKGAGRTIPNLYHYLRRLIAIATTDSLYGAKTNPMRSDLSLVDDIWTFDDALPYLTPNILPWLLAPAGHRARVRIQEALIAYYRAHPHEGTFPEDSSEIARIRGSVLRGLGFDDVDIGRMEVAMVFASTTNSAPLIFWLIGNVFTRPDVLERVRAEVVPLVEIEPIQEGGRTDDNEKKEKSQHLSRQATLRASKLTDQSCCPYLAAVHRETLRLCNTTTGTRHVTRDTVLPDGTLLRAGATVHMPSAVAHRLQEAWGPTDSAEFEPARWLETGATGSTKGGGGGGGGATKRTAYFPFGGGKHLCPGRNFAYAENAALLASLALGFEVEGLSHGTLPPCPIANLMGESVPKPRQNVQVRIRRRQGWEGVKWRLLV